MIGKDMLKDILLGLIALGALCFMAQCVAKAEPAFLKDVRWEVSDDIKKAKMELIEDTNYGGSIVDFIDRYKAIKDSGGKVKIDGFCLSACTLLLPLIPEDRLCTTEKGVLGFHSASSGLTGAYAKEATRLVWNFYPEKVRQYLKEKMGWDGDNDPHPEMIYVPAKEFVRACD